MRPLVQWCVRCGKSVEDSHQKRVLHGRVNLHPYCAKPHIDTIRVHRRNRRLLRRAYAFWGGNAKRKNQQQGQQAQR